MVEVAALSKTDIRNKVSETPAIICCKGPQVLCLHFGHTSCHHPEMAKYFEKEGNFAFPDELFPKSDIANLPESPNVAANRLEAEFQSMDSKPEGAQLECALKTLFHAEIYGTIPKQIINRACELLESLKNTNATAAYIVGNWYMFGLFGRTQAKKKAKDHYRESIKLGGIRGWYRLGSSAEEKNDIDMAVSRYECGAKLGDAACLYRLAIAILKGHFGYPKDVQKAMGLLEKACEKADEDFPQPLFLSGMVLLGEVEQGLVAPNHAKGFERIQMAAKLHFAPALIRMAAAHQQNTLPYDCAVVITYLHCAARQERFLVFQNSVPQFSGDAEIQLSKLFLCGSRPTLEPNEEWAYKFAVASVEQNNATAQFAVGYYAEVGIYIRRDLQLATTMYEQASRNNCVAAAERLAKFKTNAAGGVDLKRSTTLTRRDHEAALRRTLSQASDKGRNLSMQSIIQNVGEQLAKPEPATRPAPGSIKIDLSEAGLPSPSRNPFDSVNTPQSDFTPLTSPSSSNTSPITFSSVSKPPYPEVAKPTPYPPDRPSGQLLQPSKNTVANDEPIAPEVVASKTPYPDSEPTRPAAASDTKEKHKPSGYPVSPGELKSPYPLSPPKPVVSANKRVSGYPDGAIKIQKSSVHIPDDSEGSSRSPSPVSTSQPYPRSTSPFRSLSSQFSAPNWTKGHSRSRSASPERSPSPTRRSPLSMMSKLKSRLSMSGGHNPEDMFAPIDFDQPPQREQPSAGYTVQKSSTFQGDTILAGHLSEMTISPPKRESQPMPKPSTFDASLESIAENGSRITPSTSHRPPPGVGSRSGTPVQRKPIGSPAAIPQSSSGTPSPDRPSSPFVNGISPSTSSKQTPLAAESSAPSKPDAGVSIKRSSASIRPRGHKYTMSTAAPMGGNSLGEMKRSSRVVSSPLRSTHEPAHAAPSPALKHHALSFDEMGIQTVVEDKGGPCVIA